MFDRVDLTAPPFYRRQSSTQLMNILRGNEGRLASNVFNGSTPQKKSHRLHQNGRWGLTLMLLVEVLIIRQRR